jgi:hypothetical protein
MQANVLYLGALSGRYRVYLDGEMLTWGDLPRQTQPIAIPVSMKRLESGAPLSVAIEVFEDPTHPQADILGGETGEGFVTPQIAESLKRTHFWKARSLPLICATLFAALGAAFFFSWLSDRKKQECAIIAACAFFQALMQVCAIDLVHELMDERFWNLAQVILLLWEGSLGMLLGFAFARSRGSWMLGIGLTAVLSSSIPCSVFFFSSRSAILLSWQIYLFRWMLPLAYARGASACFIQWNVLAHRKTVVSQGPVLSACMIRRKNELLRLGSTLVLIGALYAIEGCVLSSTDSRMSVCRILNFMLLLIAYAAGGTSRKRVKVQEFENSRIVPFRKAG